MQMADLLKRIYDNLTTSVMEFAGHRYTVTAEGRAIAVEPFEPTITPLHVSSLDSLCDFVSNDAKTRSGNLFVNCSADWVSVSSDPFGMCRRRDTLIEAHPIARKQPAIGTFIDLESFMIMMRSRFLGSPDISSLLAFLSKITADSTVKVSDDGVSQTVEVKKSVATYGEAVAPLTMMLSPYRTFAEVSQPASPYFLRLKQDQGQAPRAALFEIEGDWRAEAQKSVKDYVQERLERLGGLSNVLVLG